MNKPGINRKIDFNDLLYKDEEGNLVLGVSMKHPATIPYTTITDATSNGISASEVSSTLNKDIKNLVVSVPSGGSLKVETIDGIQTTWNFNGDSILARKVIADAGNTTNTVYIGY